jgi:hypothetical protein
MNWVLISQKTTFFIVTAVNTSNLTLKEHLQAFITAKTLNVLLIAVNIIHLYDKTQKMPVSGAVLITSISITRGAEDNVRFRQRSGDRRSERGA